MNTRSSYILFPLLILTITVISCQSGQVEKKSATEKTARPSSKVDVFIVNTRPVTNDIEVPGSLLPFEETELHPEVAGRVTGIYFKEGTNVSKGTLLLKLYDEDLQAQLKKFQVQLDIAVKTEERQAELLKISGISQEDYDLSLLNVNNIRADINILKTSISKTEIRAPFGGRLGLRNISNGAYVTPQTIISTIREVNQLKLEFTVPERYGAQMQTGALIHFYIDGDTKQYSAKVIANENDISETSRSLKVRAAVEKADGKLIAGAFARVQIELDKNENAMMIPTQAVIPQARGKKVIAVRNGVASMEPVTTGIRDSAMVEVTSGLKIGDTILISGLLATKPGSKVEVNKKNN